MGIYGFWLALVISLSIAALMLVSYLARESRRACTTTPCKKADDDAVHSISSFAQTP
jgi:Na+-driven multidrug efflux pump